MVSLICKQVAGLPVSPNPCILPLTHTPGASGTNCSIIQQNTTVFGQVQYGAVQQLFESGVN